MKRSSRFILISIVAGQWGIIAGLIIIGLGVWANQASSLLGTIVTTVGTTILTAAFVGIIYEAFQKQIFAGDLQGMFNISASLQGSGITNISEPKSEIMTSFFRERELHVIPLNPIDWYSNHKSALYSAAHNHGIKVQIWIPEYDEPSLAGLLAQGQQTATDLELDLRKFLRQVEDDWNNASVHRESHLEVRTYRDVPRVGVYFSASKSILEYQAASPESPTVYRSTWIEVDAEGDFHKWSLSEASRVAKNPGAGTRLLRPSAASSSV